MSLAELVLVQAARTPEAVAVCRGEEQWSYGDLDRRSGALAARLRALGVGPEVRVGVFLRRRPGLVAALLGVLRAGGAYVPLDPAYPRERVRFMLEDAGVAGVVTEAALEGALPPGGGWRVQVEEATGAAAAAADPPPDSDALPDALSHVIYTSGSTGTPKGVGIRRGSAAALVVWAGSAFGAELRRAVAATTSISFDLSVFELFAPLAHGGRVVLLEDALELAREDTAHGAVLVNTVPSVLTEVLAAAGLPTSVTTVNLAGEALQRPLAEALYRRPGVQAVWNLYGPSEDTTYSTAERVAPGSDEPPAIGRPLPGTTAHVTGPDLRPVPFGSEGELCLGGAGLARGYLGRPAATAERFVPDPFGGAPGGRLYRTGDRARLLPDGRLAYLGRLDQQVKLRGFRIEPGEVEAALADLPGVRECAVAAVYSEAPGEGRLTAWVAGEVLEPGALRRRLAERLPPHLVPSAFVVLPALPRTLSGKLDRRALPAPAGRPARGAGGPPRTPVEEALAGIWREVLGIEGVGRDDRFLDLGGHSLLAVRAASRIRDALGAEPGVEAVLTGPSLAALARAVEAGRGGPPVPPATRRPPGERVPLSLGQEQLWYLDRGVGAGPAYNVPLEILLDGPLDLPALAWSLRRLVARHEALRLRLEEDDDGPRQRFDAPSGQGPPVVDLEGLPEAQRPAERSAVARRLARRPFELTGGRLLRTSLLRSGREEHALLLVVHHTAFDGWSAEVAVRDLGALYDHRAAGRDGTPLPEAPLGYGDFALWQRRRLAGETLERLLGHWTDRLAGAPAESSPPRDRPRPPVRTFRGARRPASVPPGLHRRVAELARRHDATPFMVLLAAFLALLGRLTGRDDLVVGILGANRGRRELEETVGLFVNVLPLRCDLSGDPTFAELLDRVREAALDAYAWQEVPFHLLVEALGPEREASRNPVFQALFQLADEPAPRHGLLNWRARELGNGTSKTDLELTLLREEEGLGGYLELDTDLFDPVTGERWLGAYRRLLEAMTAAPGERVSRVALLGAAERHQALLEWNDTAEPDPSGPAAAGEGAGSAELFLARAARTPEAVAVARGAEQWSYGELDRRSGALAARLRALGVGPEVRVGVFLRRRPELVAALLGVLRAGGAYVPLDPAYPRERVRFMLEDAGVAGVVTEAALEAALPPGAGWRLRVEDVAAEEVVSGTLTEAPPDALSHVIYTSGSTGRPKGVGIRRGSAAALVAWAGSAFGAELRRAVAATTSVCFDLSVFELFAPLARGGRVVLLEDALELARADAAAGAVLVNTVPSVLSEVLAAAGLPASVTTVNLAGEALPRPLVEALHRRPGVQAVWNLYGPSEDTTYSTAERVPPGSEEPPAIGRPLPGTRAFVVDRGLRAAPPGSEGELCLGGAGLARGYLGRPAATAERFVPDPFAASCGAPGGRLYRTGDRVRRLPDGRLAYLGRLDQQVKLRGFRIEPGEVEAALAALPGVRECAVAAVHLGSPGEGRLTAWVAGEALDADPDGGALRRGLEESLPGHLVPTAFVVLPALPRTPGGKLDRRALPAPEARPAGDGAAPVEPRSPTEALLAGLWREVLGLDRVGVTEDFFRLGGHSLKALHVTTRIRTLFGLDLPLAVLFRAPTIERMASLIDGGSSYGRSPLVRLDLPARPAADAPGALPFFCVHGVGGNVFRLVDLARLVGRPFYGLQGWSDLEDVEHLDAVDKMARRYLAEVRRVQPAGPYLLGGLCVGSMVAFEMARTLEEEGEPVAFVGVINTEMSDLAATTSLGEQRFEAGIARELRIPVSADRLRELSPEERLGYVLEEGRRLRALPEGFTLRDAERYIEIFRRNFTAALTYRPEPCGLRVTLFVATGDEGGPAPAGDTTCGWGRYAGGGVEVLEIPGDNASMLRSPQVEVLAATLAAALDAAEAAFLAPGGLALSRAPEGPAPAARRASGGGEPR